MTIQEVLAMLNMAEAEQWEFLISCPKIQEMCGNQLDAYCQPKYKRKTLADLAFRMRDETVSLPDYQWAKATKYVYEYILSDAATNYYLAASFFADKAQPIHWIAAALIAQILAKEK